MNRSLMKLGLSFCALTTIAAGCKKEPEIEQTLNSQSAETIVYTMPSEDELHEGTWLQWPHNNTYSDHEQRIEPAFIHMAKALYTGERLHIVAYDNGHVSHIQSVLQAEGVDMNKVDFCIHPTNDIWARDSGPIFVRNAQGDLIIENWGFNGWGGKVAYQLDNLVPVKAGESIGITVIDVPMIHEGGSMEIDGNGTLMAKKSSILNDNRNPGMTQDQAEKMFNKYLGITNFIWLNGVAGQDITDDHIDGTARFAHNNTIVTSSEIEPMEYQALIEARNSNGAPYSIVNLPSTLYINFYIGNSVVLVPNFGNSDDAVANGVLQNLYPTKTVVGIPASELVQDGGAIHCVTQQQPAQ